MKRLLSLAIAAGMALSTLAPLHAQTTSDKAVRIVVGNQPGGMTDTMARLIAENFSRTLDQSFIVDNRPGAAGNIAAEHVAKSAPDGRTMLLIYNSHPAIAALYPDLRFDPIESFDSIGLVAETPYLLVATPSLPGDTLSEVLEHAKKEKTTLRYASPGIGTPQHLTMERLKRLSGVDVTIAHYKGSAPGQADVAGGHVDMTLSSVALGLPMVKSGKIKVLAVTSAERLPYLPDAPTIDEAGVEGFVSVGWIALLAPRNTPPEIIRRYNDSLNQLLQTAEFKKSLDTMGASPLVGPPAALDTQMRNDAAMWNGLIKELGITAQ